MTTNDWSTLAAALTAALHLTSAPLAITFSDAPLPGVSPRSTTRCPSRCPTAAPAACRRGCVFWMKAADRTFTTVAEDHGNCSVGSLTHGFKTLDEVAGNSDVAALLDSGWVTMDVVPQIPVVRERPARSPTGRSPRRRSTPTSCSCA